MNLIHMLILLSRSGGAGGPAGKALVWGTGNYLVWGTGNYIVWGS